MQIYHCKKCGFTFSRVGKVETCPDCGKPDVRPALEHEIAEFHSHQQEFGAKSHAYKRELSDEESSLLSFTFLPGSGQTASGYLPPELWFHCLPRRWCHHRGR